MQPDPLSTLDSKQEPLRGYRVHRSPQPDGGSTTDFSSQVLAVALAGVSLLVYAIVVADGVYGPAFYGWLLVQLTVLLLASAALRYRAIRSDRVLIVSPLLVLAGLLALVWVWVSRTVLATGHPFEIVTMSVVRNLVFGLAMVSVWPAQQRLTVVLSLFLTMFGVTASDNLSTQWLAALFAVGAVGWLIVSHWENVQRRLKGRERTRWPRWVLAVPMVMLLCVGVGAARADRSVLMALRGFLPSSGGMGDSNPYARNGVGDGEMLVAGTERIQSFAPIEDAPFMQDDQPSLYDLFDDTYEEEFRITKTDRAIGLSPELASRAREHLHNRTEKANREFSTVRQSPDPAKRRRAPNIHSEALFYVAGRVPLHLRLQTYDLFDGEIWYPEQLPTPVRPLEIKNSNGKPWLQLNDRGESREYLGPAETHALKIVRMDSNVIPAPLYLHGVHIDLVDRADMFAPGPDGLVAMNREQLPSLVPIHLASRPIDWTTLPGTSKLFLRSHVSQALTAIPDDIDSDALRRLAEQWSHGHHAGWEQIAAVTEHLRSEYRIDPEWRPESTDQAGVEQFLFESKRGPDYQFATALALLLRSQGYATRVVSGFYADPNEYDVDSRHTPVLPNDVHFWAEIRVSGGDWITLEASPGYEVLGPPPGFWQRAWSAVVAVANIIARHWHSALSAVVTALLSWWKRQEIAGWLSSIHWHWLAWWTPHNVVRSTLELLRLRARLAGKLPPSSTTHHQWLSELMAHGSDQEQAKLLYSFRREIDSAAYSPQRGDHSAATFNLCLEVASRCTLTWFRQQSAGQPVAGTASRSLSNSQTHLPKSKRVERVGNGNHD